MKLSILSLVSLLFLVSCGSDEHSVASTSTVEQSCRPTATGYQFLPGPFNVPVNYHLRADRIFLTKDNQPRRRIALEFLEGDVASVQASVEATMAKAGYQSRGRKQRRDGSISARYVKSGSVNILIAVNPKVGNRPSNPDAKGVLYYEYPLGLVPASTNSEFVSQLGAN